jgi:hypothetical protein
MNEANPEKFPPAFMDEQIKAYDARMKKLTRKITLNEDRQRIVASMAEIRSLAENRELRQIDAKEEGNDQTRVTSVAFRDGWTAGFKRVTRQLQEKLDAIDRELAGIET